MPPFDSGQLNILLARLKAGDGNALDGILYVAGGRMLALAKGILGSRADAEDAVQESFLKLARSAHTFRDGTNGYAFLMRIVRNTSLDILRKKKLRTAEDIDAIFSLADETYSPQRMHEALELQEAIAKLPPESKRIIYYRYFLDFTVRDIANELNMSKSAVQRAAERAEAQLKKLLSAGQNGG